MGCDVHCHFEVKIDGKWEHYSVPGIRRNYQLFEKMAGVRGDITNAISPPKGLPDEISVITKIDVDYWNGDAHNHSWLSSTEFKELYVFHQKLAGKDWYNLDYEQYGFLFGNDFKSFELESEGYPKEIEDFRLVFWFDN